MTTTIQVRVETWKKLRELKQEPKTSFDDVIVMLLESYNEAEKHE